MSDVERLASCEILRYDKEAGAFISYCPELELYSQGVTRLQAMAALADTITCRYMHSRRPINPEPTVEELRLRVLELESLARMHIDECRKTECGLTAGQLCWPCRVRENHAL